MVAKEIGFFKKWGFVIATLAMVGVLLCPSAEGLTPVAHRALGIFTFAVILWMTECVDYSLSAIIISALMVFLIGTSPDSLGSVTKIGSSASLAMTFSGFSNSALILVASALTLAIAMTKTGLDRRIALFILSRVGTKTHHILIGTMIVGIILSFILPSTTARVSCIVPIILGIINAYGIDKTSRFGQLLMITAAHTASIWLTGVQTASSQNLVAMGFVQKKYGLSVSWLDWVIACAPYSIILTVILYFVMMKMLKPQMRKVQGGEEIIAKELKDIGPMTGDEKKLMSVVVSLLILWATQNIYHSFDAPAVTIIGVTLLLLPGIGIIKWHDVQTKLPWGTLVLFGIGISLGNVLLETNAASWLAFYFAKFVMFEKLSIFGVFAIMSLFATIIHFGFASGTALAAALTPILIALFEMSPSDLDIVGMIMLMQISVSFAFILPVNSPQNMIAYGTGCFPVKTFIKIGFVMTILAYILLLIMSATYWKWLGIL